MSFSKSWRDFLVSEKKEQTPFKSKYQRAAKAMRRRNDIYTTKGGLKNKKSGAPFNVPVKRFGTDKLRFEGLEEDIDQGTLDSFQLQDQLHPDFWKEDVFAEDISERLREIVNDFLSDLEIEIPIIDIRLTGSLANYNWSRFSDVDLHIVTDFDKIDENTEILRKLFRAVTTIWNDNHDIKINDHEVELYIEDENEEHVSSGLYSVLRDEWITKPSKENFTIDIAAVKRKAENMQERINLIQDAVEEGDYQEAYDMSEKLKKKIRDMRSSGLSEGGEYSTKNLAFKVLRREGELDRLSKLKHRAYDGTKTI